jgi:hypothetical protein
MQLPFFERRAEAFLGALNRERYLHGAGLKATLDVRPIYDAYRDILSLDTYSWLRDQHVDPTYLRYLLDFQATHLLESEVATFDERLANGEAAAHVEWIGERTPLRTAIVRQMVEPDRDRRHWLNELVRGRIVELNVVRLERRRILEHRTGDLGYSGSIALRDDLRGLGLADLGEVARSLLEATEDDYNQALRDQLAHHRLDAGDAWEVDLEWILRGAEYDSSFAVDRLLPSLYRTFGGLGLRLEDQGNVRLDDEARPLKSPRAFWAPIGVPGDVVVVVRPVGGRPDFDATLCAFGHAERLANADRTGPFGYRWLGDPAVGEAYAGLFRSLTTDPGWLRWQLELDDPRDALRLGRFHALCTLRRWAATLSFVLEPGGTEEPEEGATGRAERLSDALGVRFFAEECVADDDSDVDAAVSLRGRLLETVLRAFLRREYDEEWFRSPRAGRFLVERWREGQRYLAEELARFMGADGLRAEPMLEELRTDPAS